jgi:hypothetical protein
MYVSTSKFVFDRLIWLKSQISESVWFSHLKRTRPLHRILFIAIRNVYTPMHLLQRRRMPSLRWRIAFKVTAMEFVLLLAIFLTSSGYLIKGSVSQAPPAATAPTSPTENGPAADTVREKQIAVL